MSSAVISLTPQDLLAAWRLQRRNSVAVTISRFVPILLIAIYAWSIWPNVVDYGWEAAFQDVTMPILVVVLVASNLLQEFVLLPRRAQKILEQQKGLGGEITYDWDQDGLRVTGETGHSRLAWGDYVRWLEDDRVLVLFQSDNILNLMPKSRLTSKQAAEIRERLTAEIGKAGARKKRKKKSKT